MTSASTPHSVGRPLRRPVGDVGGQLVEPDGVRVDPRLVDRARRGRARASSPASARCRCPGSGWMNSSADSAVIVRIGSITTTLAPSARAASIVGHRWRLVRRVFVAHSRISRLWRSSSGSRPRLVPLVIRTPAPTVGPQIARSIRLAPRWWKNRPSRPITDEQALVAGVAERQDRLGAVLVDDAVQAGGDLGQGVVPRHLLEPALALGADPAQRPQDPLRAVHAVEEAVDLRAQLALAERVIGASAQLDGPPSSTVTSHPHESGQSWWHVPCTISATDIPETLRIHAIRGFAASEGYLRGFPSANPRMHANPRMSGAYDPGRDAVATGPATRPGRRPRRSAPDRRTRSPTSCGPPTPPGNESR